MKCIYTKMTEQDTDFTKVEHVFPAGIGGKATLPLGSVSDYANENFSKIERFFMQESILMIPRIFNGPGKRGSHSPIKRTQSKVCILEDPGTVSLGYTELGNPYIITQVMIPFNDVKKNGIVNIQMSFPPNLDKLDENFEIFSKKIKGTRHVLISTDKLKINDFIVGYHKKNLYIAYNPVSDLKDFKIYLKDNFELKEDLLVNQKKNIRESHVTVALDFKMDIKGYSRVCAKIAFNTLCHIENSEFVLKKDFDRIREFIINGVGNPVKFVQLMQGEEIKKIQKFLDVSNLAHRVIFFKRDNNELYAILTMYGISHLILLSDEYNGHEIFQGFICDWENKKELLLTQHLSEITNS